LSPELGASFCSVFLFTRSMCNLCHRRFSLGTGNW
jgi:hypothetical protein